MSEHPDSRGSLLKYVAALEANTLAVQTLNATIEQFKASLETDRSVFEGHDIPRTKPMNDSDIASALAGMGFEIGEPIFVSPNVQDDVIPPVSQPTRAESLASAGLTPSPRPARSTESSPRWVVQSGDDGIAGARSLVPGSRWTIVMSIDVAATGSVDDMIFWLESGSHRILLQPATR